MSQSDLTEADFDADSLTWKRGCLADMSGPRPPLDAWTAASDRLTDALDGERRQSDVALLTAVKELLHDYVRDGAERNLTRAERKAVGFADDALNRRARRSRTAPTVKGQVQQAVKVTTPPQYLTTWRETLDAVGLGNNPDNRAKVRKLNQSHTGPILLPSKGGQPKVAKAKLIEWWNKLEIEFEQRRQQQIGRTATLQEQHPHGRTAKVIPGIAGHVKQRRKSGR
jgi:hypothetical protein